MVMKKEAPEKAVALVYNKKRSDAPQVVASGKGQIARNIIETAREHGVYIKEDHDLVELLSQVPVGEEIPAELYKAIAEVLAFVYQVNGRYKESAQEPVGELEANNSEAVSSAI